VPQNAAADQRLSTIVGGCALAVVRDISVGKIGYHFYIRTLINQSSFNIPNYKL